ncbi:hypothetical protein IWQ56_007105, partial [Coemansia nantahalensis]
GGSEAGVAARRRGRGRPLVHAQRGSGRVADVVCRGAPRCAARGRGRRQQRYRRCDRGHACGGPARHAGDKPYPRAAGERAVRACWAGAGDGARGPGTGVGGVGAGGRDARGDGPPAVLAGPRRILGGRGPGAQRRRAGGGGGVCGPGGTDQLPRHRGAEPDRPVPAGRALGARRGWRAPAAAAGRAGARPRAHAAVHAAGRQPGGCARDVWRRPAGRRGGRHPAVRRAAGRPADGQRHSRPRQRRAGAGAGRDAPALDRAHDQPGPEREQRHAAGGAGAALGGAGAGAGVCEPQAGRGRPVERRVAAQPVLPVLCVAAAADPAAPRGAPRRAVCGHAGARVAGGDAAGAPA